MIGIKDGDVAAMVKTASLTSSSGSADPGHGHPPRPEQRFIADADAAFPANPTSVHTLHASHSSFLSMPAQVAGIVLKLHR